MTLMVLALCDHAACPNSASSAAVNTGSTVARGAIAYFNNAGSSEPVRGMKHSLVHE
jgi:hypothetical protein